MLKLKGKAVALAQEELVKAQVAEFEKNYQRKPKLVVLLVGADPASHVYVKNKELGCERVGLASERFDLPETISEAALIERVRSLNTDRTVDAILVQMPLPKHINSENVIEAIDPLKDVDGLTSASMGRLWSGRARVAACTPAGVIEILKFYGIAMSGQNAVVIGRSNIVGKPMAQLLLDEQATITICHSKTKDLEAFTRQADIVVVAAGRPRFLGKSAFKKDAVVIDVGIHRKSDGKLCGDVKFEELEGYVKAATPVPGGVGPMTIAMLLRNTMTLARLHK